MDWNTPIQFVPLIGPAYAKRLEKLEITTVADLLLHLPTRHEDFSRIVSISQLKSEEPVTVKAKILEFKNQYLRSGRTIQKAVMGDETQTVEVVWFNQPYLTKTFHISDLVAIAGTPKEKGFVLTFAAPEIELIKHNKSQLHTGRLVPIYPETAGVSSKWLRSRIAYLLTNPVLTMDYLPQTIKAENHLQSLDQALNTIHFPKLLSDIDHARTRLAFDELFLLQLANLKRKREWQTAMRTQVFTISQDKILDFIEKLPFNLTIAQKRCVQEILTDISQTKPMNRLLQGDVGSGKTVVAAIAIYATFLNGFTSLFMAPTEILAQQHFDTLSKLLTPFGISVNLRTGAHKNESGVKNGGLKDPNNRNPDVLVGTHALIEKEIQLNNVALVIIDEQHRFGVAQRALLRQKGTVPHVLTMTATPIPRTMALTIYGDLDLSVLDEMPRGRLPVKTWVVPPEKRNAAYAWIAREIIISNKIHQAFIVCPFIEPSESLQTIKAATQEFEKLSREVFPDLRLALLHGKLKQSQKEQILQQFRNGEFNILVTTPVVEVGIDISTATIMLIEAAERFGLAQLHQLRGRVGRGKTQSYCLLFTDTASTTSIARLKNLEKTVNGAHLAELDFKLRGPGDVFGTAQHGQKILKIASFTNSLLIQTTRTQAQKLLAQDPSLTNFPLLKQRLTSGTISQVTPD